MTPAVSILLPYRDVAETIEEAMASLLSDRTLPVELLAVDDGSADDGPARVARLAAADPRVRPLRAGGVGIVGALSLALAEARAPLVARMDGDDVALRGRLAKQVELLGTNHRLGVVGSLVEPFPAEAVAGGLRRYVAWQNSLVTAEDHARELFVESPLCHPSVLFRREALEEVGGWREVPGPEDYDLFLRLDAAGWRMAKVPEPLLRWRHRPGRATFADPRYSLERHRETKAPFLAARLRRLGREVALWGAGATGRRLARALEPHGVRAVFIDIDPRKIGRTARGAPIRGAEALERGRHTVVVAVGAAGARELVRERLASLGFVEGEDFLGRPEEERRADRSRIFPRPRIRHPREGWDPVTCRSPGFPLSREGRSVPGDAGQVGGTLHGLPGRQRDLRVVRAPPIEQDRLAQHLRHRRAGLLRQQARRLLAVLGAVRPDPDLHQLPRVERLVDGGDERLGEPLPSDLGRRGEGMPEGAKVASLLAGQFHGASLPAGGGDVQRALTAPRPPHR